MLSIRVYDSIYWIGFSVYKNFHFGLLPILLPNFVGPQIQFSFTALFIAFLSFTEPASEFWDNRLCILDQYFPHSWSLLVASDLNDPHKIRVRWHLGCISYCVSLVGVRMEILICWLAILNTDFLVYFSDFFYNTFDFSSL